VCCIGIENLQLVRHYATGSSSSLQSGA